MQNFKLIIIFILSITSAYAQKGPYEFYLRAGVTFQNTIFNELDDDQYENKYDIEDREESKALGIYTQFSFRLERIEIGLESHTTFGRGRDLRFAYENRVLEGEGNFRSFNITPTIRINSDVYEIDFLDFIGFKTFKAYIKFGPSWLLNSLDLDDFNINTNGKSLKINYDSFGGALAIGVEQVKTVDHFPFFAEVSVAAYRSYKATLVDRTNRTKVEILQEQSAREDINSFSIFYTIGASLF
ncbi:MULTISPECIES: hypothetical protein [unclassified Halobacteriovorax]|uniref:hypothetical protein n=1 Tax=unclassified Halobacteriovorax TaxID=2639665 RepID=UPI00399C22B0